MKSLLIEDGGIVGVIDWELACPASPAFDLGRWEVSAGGQPIGQSETIREPQERKVTDRLAPNPP